MGQASKQHSELEKYEVDVDPIGFPVKTYVPRDNIKVNLNLISPKGFAEIFGVGDKDFSRIIEIALREGEVKTIDELCERISKKGQTDEFSEFEMYKAARILKLAEIIYPKLFGGKNEIDEMMKKGNANIARASIIDAESLDERSTLLLAHSLVRGIFLEAKNGKSVMIVLPNVEFMQANEKTEIISSEIYDYLNKIAEQGSYFCISAGKTIDIEKGTRDSAEVNINIVSANDVSVQLKARKGYRVLIRPALSQEA